MTSLNENEAVGGTETDTFIKYRKELVNSFGAVCWCVETCYETERDWPITVALSVRNSVLRILWVGKSFFLFILP